MFDLLIRGGSVVNADGVREADIAIENGVFVAVAPDLAEGAQEIEAKGLTIFPGLIDVHLHFNEPGRTEWEGIASGSRAFASGGGTAFFDMPLNSTPCTFDGPSFDLKRRAMEQSSITDFGLWGGLTPNNLDTLDELAERGAIGFKAFMCDSGLPEFERADDLTLYEGMRVAARWGLPVAVHAESEELVKGLTRRIRSNGGETARDYLNSRPMLAEQEAIQRAALIARDVGARLHIVHVSSGRGVALAAELRASGVDLTIETCPHYLTFTEEDLERLGAVAKCSPPLRPAAERDLLWDKVLSGDVDIIASDHSPAPPEMKSDTDFFRLWGGIAGVQSTLGVLLETGAHQHGLELSAVANLIATAPAKRFHIPTKGSIAMGFDADCTIVDAEAGFEVTTESLRYRHKQSPYVGRRLRGVVKRTIRRGVTIFESGNIVESGSGRMVRPAGGE